MSEEQTKAPLLLTWERTPMQEARVFLDKAPTPKQTIQQLDEHVIGQDDVKEKLAVAMRNHRKRLEYKAAHAAKGDGLEIDKSNVLVIGPTGSGKTMMVKTLAKFLDIPVAFGDATSITEAGYVGGDVEDLIASLLQAADGDVARAQKGIIFLDEIDKLSRKSESPSVTRDVGGEGVQQGLLKLIEGSKVKVTLKKGAEPIFVDTTDILFVFSGAFEGIEKIIEARTVKKSGIGFSAHVASPDEKPSQKQLLDQIDPSDLVKFGMIPELIGRLPVVGSTEALDEDKLVHIMTQPKNAITKQFEALFELDGVKLTITEDACREIARQAQKIKTGARGLRKFFENATQKTQAILPELADDHVIEVVFNAAAVRGEEKPKYVRAVANDDRDALQAYRPKAAAGGMVPA